MGPRSSNALDLPPAERLAIALEAADLGDWWWRGADDALILSPRAARSLGLPTDEPLTWSRLLDQIAPEDRDATRGAIEDALSREGRFTLECHVEAGTRDRWVVVTGRGRYDNSGHLLGVAGLVQDVTERHEAARSREEHLRAIVEATPECVTIVSRDGRLLEMNPAGLRMMEADGAASVVGAHAVDLVAPAFREQWTQAHARVCGGESLSWAFEVVGLKGRRRWMETHAVPLPLPGGELVELSVTRDITDRRWAEQERDHLLEAERAARSDAERASRLKDEFLATLSHELRTPLNAILGWSHMLREGDRGAADIRRGLDVIARNARAQAQIIDDLLDMSRIIAGKIRLEVRPVDVARVVEAAIETARPAAEARDIRLQPVLDPRAAAIAGDPDRLQQVLWNLLSNAIKFTPRGGRVQVVVERANGHVEVAVTDTGEGMAPEFIPFVFDRFRQIDASTTRRHGGLGLGLSIVKQLVEMHGGTVRASSQGVGQGATFTVSLPITAVQAPEGGTDEAATAVPPEMMIEAAPGLHGVSVLIVDDERDAAEIVDRVLVGAGAETAVANSVDEAIEWLNRRAFHVLVSDIGMPGTDGYTLMRHIRAAEGPARHMAALALTAYARPQDRRKALLSGYQMHAAKPIEPAELVLMVASLAGRTRAS